MSKKTEKCILFSIDACKYWCKLCCVLLWRNGEPSSTRCDRRNRGDLRCKCPFHRPPSLTHRATRSSAIPTYPALTMLSKSSPPMYVWLCIFLSVCVYVCLCVYMLVCVYACLSVCMPVCVYACLSTLTSHYTLPDPSLYFLINSVLENVWHFSDKVSTNCAVHVSPYLSLSLHVAIELRCD